MKKLWSDTRRIVGNSGRSAYRSVVVAWIAATVFLLLLVFARPSVEDYPKTKVVITQAFDTEGKPVTRLEWLDNVQKLLQ